MKSKFSDSRVVCSEVKECPMQPGETKIQSRERRSVASDSRGWFVRRSGSRGDGLDTNELLDMDRRVVVEVDRSVQTDN